MGRLMGFVCFAAALWVATEIYTQGLQGAFGGALAQSAELEPVTRTKHAAGAFQRAYDSSGKRVDRGLERAR